MNWDKVVTPGGGGGGSSPADLLRGPLSKPSLNTHLPAISHCLIPPELHEHTDSVAR